MSANSAAVNSPYPTTSSLAGRVHGAVEARFDVDTGAAGGNEDHLALAGGDERRGIEEGGDPHLVGSPGTRSEAQFEDDLCAVGPDHAVDVAGEMPASASAPNAPVRAMEVESCSGKTRACTVLWTPTMATSANGCDDWRVMDGSSRSAPLVARRLLSHRCAAGAGEDLRRIRDTARPHPTDDRRASLRSGWGRDGWVPFGRWLRGLGRFVDFALANGRHLRIDVCRECC